jgi:predicted nucleotidyltransferase
MQDLYEHTIAELRTVFVEVCKSVFGENLVAVINKGSTVKGGFIPGLSDIDFHVYLKKDAFIYNDFLKVEYGLRMQKKMSPLIQNYDIGGGPIQVNILNEAHLPDWSGPLKGTYLILYGDSCPEPEATTENLLTKDLDNLKHPTAYKWIHTYADKTDDQLPNFIRSLNTQVNPTLFRVLSLLTGEPLNVWKLTKFEAIVALEALEDESAKKLARLGREFFALAKQRERQRKDAEFCRETIRAAFRAIDLGREIGNRITDCGNACIQPLKEESEMEQSDKKQESPPVDEFRSQLKGIIPRRLSDEEFGDLIEWLKENAKNVWEFEIKEYEKHVREISKPPERVHRNKLDF